MKSPAFLFYSKDWIADTADWAPESKGVYIDLLAHQHVNGDLPMDIKKLSRIARMSSDEFIPIWEEIKDKFDHVDNRLVNQRLDQVINQSQEKAKRNRISGIFASCIRTSDLKAKDKEAIKKSFDIQHFTSIANEKLEEEIKKWFNHSVDRLVNRSDDHIVNVNANEDIEEKNNQLYAEIISYLNEKTGKTFRHQTPKTRSCIDTRIMDGYKVPDFKKVIDNKIKDWLEDEKFSKFLRPETLFGNKFESYLNEKPTKINHKEIPTVNPDLR